MTEQSSDLGTGFIWVNKVEIFRKKKYWDLAFKNEHQSHYWTPPTSPFVFRVPGLFAVGCTYNNNHINSNTNLDCAGELAVGPTSGPRNGALLTLGPSNVKGFCCERVLQAHSLLFLLSGFQFSFFTCFEMLSPGGSMDLWNSQFNVRLESLARTLSDCVLLTMLLNCTVLYFPYSLN